MEYSAEEQRRLGEIATHIGGSQETFREKIAARLGMSLDREALTREQRQEIDLTLQMAYFKVAKAEHGAGQYKPEEMVVAVNKALDWILERTAHKDQVTPPL